MITAVGDRRPAPRPGDLQVDPANRADAGPSVPGASRTRVLIVDDHRAFADALTIAIGVHADLASVGTALSIAGAIELARRATPDVVLLDIHLPDGDGIEALARISEAAPGARILILTGHTDVEVLARAAAAGAAGFLPKESSIASVIGAIRGARAGEMHVEGVLLAAILGRVAAAPPPPGPDEDDPVLTPRERDVLRLMGQGMDPHAIAAALRISLHTCRGYQKAIMAKLQAHSQLEAVVVATRRGLLPRGTVAG
jgi:DNA-binding NarL/FixJ family response regulator